jgi:gamma-glutamyl-gamma-aminobutyrate hydrolase PuuD
MRLIIAGNFYGAHTPFVHLFKDLLMLSVGKPHTFKEGDVLLLGGGEDIAPEIYNQKPSRYNGSQVGLSRRDDWEVSLFKSAQSAGCLIIGICRGAQLSCALSGGSLYQHVVGHGQSHTMTTSDGRELLVSSVHHQMMNPEKTKHKLLGWSTDVRSRVHLVEGEKDIAVKVEPEVIFFEDTKALAIQYHPEFMADDAPAVKYAQQLVTNLVTSKEKSNEYLLA